MSHQGRSWMRLDKASAEWQQGLTEYLDSTFGGSSKGGTAPCPCSACRSSTFIKRSDVQNHLLRKGFDESFIREQESICEGSAIDDDDDVDDRARTTELLHSMIRGEIRGEIDEEQPNEMANKFFKLLQEAKKELFPGCTEANKFFKLLQEAKKMKSGEFYKLSRMSSCKSFGLESAFSKIEKRIELEASMISKEQEKHILHETYKETTGCRSKKGPGHGYLAKYSTRSQLMNERIEEQAHASALAAAAQQKNSEMQAEVEKLKELTIQAAERESDKEKIQQLQHQLESTSSKIREELRQELFSLIKQQNQAPPLNATPTTIAHQPTETATHPSELTTNATGIENMVSANEGADLAKAGTESVLPTHNEPAAVPTPIQGSEHVQQTVADSVLLSKQNSILPRVLRSSANISLFPNDKDSNETVTFITIQTLRNTAANKKRQCRKKGGKEDQP